MTREAVAAIEAAGAAEIWVKDAHEYPVDPLLGQPSAPEPKRPSRASSPGLFRHIADVEFRHMRMRLLHR